VNNCLTCQGLISLCICFLAFWQIPKGPETAKFLDQEEKIAAVDRLRVDSAGTTEGGRTRWKHVRQALTSIHVLVCGLGFFFGNTAAQSFSVFAPSIIAAMGYSSTRAQLLSVGPYVSICAVFEYLTDMPGCCMHFFDSDRLVVGPIQEASHPDHCIRAPGHCWLFHARISASRSAFCQIWCAVSCRHWTLCVLANLARMGGQQLCHCNSAGGGLGHRLYHGKLRWYPCALDILTLRCAKLSHRSCNLVELLVRFLGMCCWVALVLQVGKSTERNGKA
jgi:hypothetical protein